MPSFSQASLFRLITTLVIGGLTPLMAGLVEIEGVRSVSAEKAHAWIASQEEYVKSAGISPARADDLAYFLETALRQRGYSKATVDWRLTGSGQERRIHLIVDEGSELKLGRLTVDGAKALDDAAIFELLTTPTTKRLKNVETKNLPYVKTDIEEGRAQVVAFYQLMGYREAKVAVNTRIESGRANLHLTVIEGNDSIVGNIILPSPPDPSLTAEFERIRESFQGKVFSAAVPDSLASRVREVAVNRGYYHAKVNVEERNGGQEAGQERVDLLASADWGAPVSISTVRVKGNEKVKTEFFNRHFASLLDRPYSPAKSIETVNDLLQTGAFETVRTDISDLADGTYALDVEVEEGYSRTLGIYGGFTNYEGPIAGFEFRHLNLFGMVRRADAALEFSQRGVRGEANYTDPWFLDSPIQFTGGLFALNRVERGYEKLKTGGRYEFTHRFGPEKKDSIAFFGEAAYTDVHDADISPAYLGKTNYFAHQMGLSFARDRRDDPRRPHKGYIAQASMAAASSAMGSEIEYWKATGRLGFYLPFGDQTLRLGARSGIISPMGGTKDIPIDLRYFNGGPFSVRSFQERSLGPRDPKSGDPVGGNFYTIFNAEYEIPISALPGLSIVPFADAGNLLFDESDAGLSHLRYALGLGLRYDTPIGPIRLEYGWNPDAQAGEPDGTLHLGFGLGY